MQAVSVVVQEAWLAANEGFEDQGTVEVGKGAVVVGFFEGVVDWGWSFENVVFVVKHSIFVER